MSNKLDQVEEGIAVSSPAAAVCEKPLDSHVNVGTVAIESERAIAEVKAAVVMARTFPRDEMLARQKVLAACGRPEFASSAIYRYPRGGQNVEGPSIRLAEVLARAWGNMHYGFRELAQYEGESEIEAYCWDLESNNRATVSFRVKHSRYKAGTVQRLSDPRDIYENNANNASRRLRRCILECIDPELVAEAVAACRRTIAAGVSSKRTLAQKTKELCDEFARRGVKVEHLTKWLGRPLDTILPEEYVDLAGIFVAIRDGANPSDYFDVPRGTTLSQKAQEAEALLKPKPAPRGVAPEPTEDALVEPDIFPE